MNTRWGKLFKSYGDGQVVMPGMEPKTVVQATIGLGLAASALGALIYLGNRKKKQN